MIQRTKGSTRAEVSVFRDCLVVLISRGPWQSLSLAIQQAPRFIKCCVSFSKGCVWRDSVWGGGRRRQRREGSTKDNAEKAGLRATAINLNHPHSGRLAEWECNTYPIRVRTPENRHLFLPTSRPTGVNNSSNLCQAVRSRLSGVLLCLTCSYSGQV